jgi:hypothetical protein
VTLQHPMSTKVIKRHFELTSNANLRSADSNLDYNMPEEIIKGRIMTARNGTMSDSSEQKYNAPQTNMIRRNPNPFTFDTEDESYVN